MDLEAAEKLSGDEGGVTLVPPGRQATLLWRELSVTINKGGGETKEILHSVYGYVEPGQMVALMGPSGGGKSTLLDALAGRLGKRMRREGEVLLNGHNQSLAFGVAAYVQQDDFLFGALTVRETISIAARLRLPASMSSAEKKETVETVLQEMGLQDASNSYIGNWHMRGISNGQKRRVSIAVELITEPALLFLDEPTSGLDSAAAFFVTCTVRRLVNAGRTVVCAIHQPSGEVYSLFDSLCLLSGGSVVYFGPRDEALSVFSEAGFPCPPQRNPPDHFLRAVNRDFNFLTHKAIVSDLRLVAREPLDELDTEQVVDRLQAAYHRSSTYQTAKARLESLSQEQGSNLPAVKVLGIIPQTLVLTQRAFTTNLRNLGLFWLRLGMYAALMVCVGTIYHSIGLSYTSISARAAVLFFIVAFLTFMSVAGFPAFLEDMKVFERERAKGYYGVLPFAIADTLASAPFLFLIALTSTLIGYFLIHLNETFASVVCFCLLLFASLEVSEALMMSMAAIVPNFLMGIAAGAGIMGMYMLVCGFFRLPPDIPKPVWRYPFHYVAFHTYAFQGFMRNEFDGLTFQGPTPSGWPPVTSEEALAMYDIPMDLGSQVTKWVDLAILFGWTVFYRLLFFGNLKLKEFIRTRM